MVFGVAYMELGRESYTWLFMKVPVRRFDTRDGKAKGCIGMEDIGYRKRSITAHYEIRGTLIFTNTMHSRA